MVSTGTPSVNGQIVLPTLMWVEALELMLHRLSSKLDIRKVAVVSGSGQQHGSVYWKIGSSAKLSSLDPKKPLAYACIDETDGAGMNFMDIKPRAWSKIALETTASGLEEKLGKLVPAYAVVGLIAPYFVEGFGFNKNCLVVQWSGENPQNLADLKNGLSSYVVMQVDPTLLMIKWIYFLCFVAMKKGLLLSSGWVNRITHVGQRFVRGAKDFRTALCK
ncbi:hypothetical protein TEA_012066 [Camellia sinensis var. sinensis]|uniref:Carbohydrate kinase FGGY N-terminal domain-containing protein n=1 Tax=Camellia sinensis var. sinensis TaxID=542762 RepID=A0A4S4D4A1_CAMSN|nr:hypothetical protein TEA_012066 [Camellia sinensis var. sinensis]